MIFYISFWLIICTKLVFATPLDNSDLVAVTQIFRHGDRNPTTFFPTDPYSNLSYWPGGLGQLTNDGKRRHYTLGQYTNQRYAGFLPEEYNSNDFFVETTDVDRTHMSAQANAAGIFPPEGAEVWSKQIPWQPIPIHPAPERIITTIPDCQTFYTETANVAAEGKFLPRGTNYTATYQYLSEQTGSTVNSLMAAFLIEDELKLEELRGYQLPEWTKQVYPEPLKTIADYFFIGLSYSDNQKRLTTGGWFYEVLTDFETIWVNGSKPKYHIYSGHDINIATILSTLGVFDIKAPGFASTLYFELRNKTGEAILNIWFKDGDNLEKIVPLNCQFDCPLATLRKNLEPWLVDGDTWLQLCANATDYYTPATAIDPEFLESIHDEIFDHDACLRAKDPHNVKRKKKKEKKPKKEKKEKKEKKVKNNKTN